MQKSGILAIGTRIRCVKSPEHGYSNIQKGDTGTVVAGGSSDNFEKKIKIDKTRKVYMYDIKDEHCYKKLGNENTWMGQHRVRRRGVYASRK